MLTRLFNLAARALSGLSKNDPNQDAENREHPVPVNPCPHCTRSRLNKARREYVAERAAGRDAEAPTQENVYHAVWNCRGMEELCTACNRFPTDPVEDLFPIPDDEPELATA